MVIEESLNTVHICIGIVDDAFDMSAVKVDDLLILTCNIIIYLLNLVRKAHFISVGADYKRRDIIICYSCNSIAVIVVYTVHKTIYILLVPVR